MTEMRVGDQTIRYDRDATAAVYRPLEHGFAETCECIFRKNFAAQRNLISPDSFRALLDQLGIDPNKEPPRWRMVLFCMGNGDGG